MATSKPDLTRVWANTAPPANVVDPDVTTPGKVSAGWQAEVPPFEHFNFLQKWFTQGLAHLNEQGVGVWDTDTTYPVNGLAKGSDGKVYIALQEQSGNDPISDDGTNWAVWNQSIRNKESISSLVDSIGKGEISVGDISSTSGYFGGWTATADGPKGGNFYELVDAGSPGSRPTEDGGRVIYVSGGSGGLYLKGLFLDGIYNVYQFGAKGNKIADDTTSCQNAIEAAYGSDAQINNAIVFFPAGSFLIDPEIGLSMKDNTQLLGSGFGMTEIIPLNGNATARTGYTDGLIRRPFTAAPGNERIQMVRIEGFRFVIRGANQTMVNLGHMGRSLCYRNRITVQDRAQEFTNNPQTIFAGSKGIVFGVADSVPNGYAGGEACVIDFNIVEFAATSIDSFGPVHGTKITNNDLQEARVLISVSSTGASGGEITGNVLQNIRTPGAGACVDLSGYNWTIENNYFEPTANATEQILLRTGSRGNKVGHNRFDTTNTVVTDDGTGNKFPGLAETHSHGVAAGISNNCAYEGQRTSTLALSTAGESTLIFNQEDLNLVDNSNPVGTTINPNTSTTGVFFAPFDGMYTICASIRLDPDVAADVETRLYAGSTLKKVSEDNYKAAGTTYKTFTATVFLSKNDSLELRSFPVTAVASLDLVSGTDVNVSISGTSIS